MDESAVGERGVPGPGRVRDEARGGEEPVQQELGVQQTRGRPDEEAGGRGRGLRIM